MAKKQLAREPGTPSSSLRDQAESQSAQVTPRPFPTSREETTALIHELQVHQIELEMQNETLRRTQIELTAARDRYLDLYEQAPVGYLTLSQQNLILQVNHTFLNLAKVTHHALIQHPFSNFILQEDRTHFYLFSRQLSLNLNPPSIDLRMERPDGTVFWATLTATLVNNDEGELICRIVLVDITAQKQAEAVRAQQFEELSRWQRVSLGREGRIVELKREVNILAKRLVEKPPYAEAPL